MSIRRKSSARSASRFSAGQVSSAASDMVCAASLASLYQAGRGVKRDLAESYKWYALAALEADEGDTKAAEALAALGANSALSPEAKQAARAEAEKLYEQIFGEEKKLPAGK